MTIYLIGLVVGAYGISQVKIDFKIEFWIGEDEYVREILDKQKHWFDFGFSVTHYIDNPYIDYSSE